MTEGQWQDLCAAVSGKTFEKPLTAFIADSPWLPEWTKKHSILDYYTSDDVWLKVNLEAIRSFPETIFLPGFWSEYGMCTEPSAFGSRLIWHEHELPFAEAVWHDSERAPVLNPPDVASAGLLPFALRRLQRCRPAIEAEGHSIRFAVARGPLNIASFLMGTTEFLTAMQCDPEGTHGMLEVITRFLEEWIQLQAKTIPTIRGVMLLDDIVGFIGPEDVRTFAAPYLTRAFAAIDSEVRLFHNDADGLSCAPILADCGVNLFNFAFHHPIQEMRERVGPTVTLLGNIPPRDVLAAGTPVDVEQAVECMKTVLGGDFGRVIFSCGGGIPPGVSSENLSVFLAAAR